MRTLIPWLAIAAAPGYAQTAVSGITGTVRDSTGIPLDRVVVEARDSATGYSTRAATNTTGRYILLGLPLGGTLRGSRSPSGI